MSYIVVLEVPQWAEKNQFNDSNFTYKNYLIRCDPVFNRHGLYLWRRYKRAVLECEYGCFDLSKDYSYYKSEVYDLDHIPLTDDEYKALNIIIATSRIRIDKSQLIKIRAAEKQRRYLRNLYINTRMVCMKSLRKVKECM